MRIIHYMPDIDRKSGGTTAYIQLLAKELGKIVDLHIVTHKTQAPVNLENCKIHYIPSWNNYLKMKTCWSKILDNYKPEIIHINGCWTPGCALTQKWAQKKGYKIVLTPHGMLEPWIIKRNYWTRKLPALLLYQKKAIRKADCIHATAFNEQKHLLTLGYNKNIAIIANGIEVNNISLKKEWKRNNEILFLSRVHPKKGINLLIESITQIKDELKDFKVNIAGEGNPDYIIELKNLVKQKGISDIVHFIGGVYGENKWNLFKKADVFILPTYSENFGIVIAEALASGTPVITTKGTPWKELEEHNCGWYVDIDSEHITKSLQEFLSLTDEQLHKMGKNGRKLVEENYSIENIAIKMKTLYNWIINRTYKPNFMYEESI